MDCTVWGSSDTEMDIMERDSLQREDAIEKGEIRLLREREIEEARAFTEDALRPHADRLAAFLGYVKALSVRRRGSEWVSAEKSVWDEVKTAILRHWEVDTSPEEAGEQIVRAMDKILSGREQSVEKIAEAFRSLALKSK
ncbi:uncharacterized protein NEMAJ01_0774 [Nematocida major]|uniref:uncharacterized protein n=1 Tax=Nematocida major TaxID=1912982 RepID=UPI002008ACFB|nr:uncharacterized protein NEMAJ01_0774 [Nematocida major]KAH9385878.1 hypothetical protein NEMAJ01_0774 [Nematocida major]